MSRDYYSARTGKIPKNGFDIDKLRQLIIVLFNNYWDNDYFQEYFGYECVDQGHVPGRFGSYSAIESRIFLCLHKNLWPFDNSLSTCNEDEIFDIIEFLYDHVSSPRKEKGYFHSYNQCGWHFNDLDTDFTQALAQYEFRINVNHILPNYAGGFEITKEGEIISIADKGFESLLETPVPFKNKDLNSRLEHAIQLFRSGHSTIEQRLDALKNLADILENLRKEASSVLTSKDENDLFQILNQFGIRHNDLNQKFDYDKPIFYSWMFYYYLAAIHACQRLINRAGK